MDLIDNEKNKNREITKNKGNISKLETTKINEYKTQKKISSCLLALVTLYSFQILILLYRIYLKIWTCIPRSSNHDKK